MRDLLQGFDWFVEREAKILHRLEQSAKAVESGKTPADRVDWVRIKNFETRFSRLSVRYSAGVDLATLAPEVRWLLDRVDERPVGSPRIWGLGSLSLLLQVVDGEAELQRLFPSMQNMLAGAPKYHRVADWVLGVDSRPEPYFERESGPSSLWKVIDAAEAGDSDGARTSLEQMVNTGWLPEILHDIPLDPEHWTYCGLWCWEGALAAVRYGIDDSALLGSAHWPGDVVAAARAGTVFPRVSDRDYEACMLGGGDKS